MVGSTVKGRAFPSKSKCEALTLMSADSEPVKSSMKEFAGSPLDGEGEITKIQNKEKFMDGRKTDERFCGPVVGNGIEVKEQVVCEGNDEERYSVDEIKLYRSDYVSISGNTRGYVEEVNDGGGLANNMDERNTEEVIVKDNETVIYGLDIKYANVGEERKSLEVVTDNMVDGGLADSEFQIMGKDPTDNLQTEKEANKLHTEVPTGTNLGNETVIYGLDITDPNIREERKSLDVATDNMVDGGLAASALQITGNYLTDNLQSEKEDKLNTEVPMGANLDNETVIYGVDIKDADAREERKSLEMATDNMVGRALPALELQLTGKNLTDCLQNEKEANRLNTELAMGINLDNETVIYGMDINDANTREDGKSLKPTTDSIVDGGFVASELQIEGKKLTYNAHNENEANKLNTKVPICTTVDNGRMECGSSVDASVANNLKESPNNINIPKRRRLNRKMFEKTVLGNNEATMNEAKPQSSIGNGACIEVNDADMNKHVKKDDKAEATPLANIGRKLNRLRRKQVPQSYAGTTTANDEQKSQRTNDSPENKVNKETDELDMKNEEAEKSQRNKEKKVEPERTKKVAVESSKSSKRVDIAGMIFMCSSETKEDCYNYRVLALPACKRDIVSKIYKGMRLFLFDFELKMMYGIYKAAGPGGYNIEPRAFGSQFPSQVRFTVVENCVPLVEEKFRSAIKDNYYTKHKFNCQLTSEQVKNLCKLFHDTSKRAQSKLAIRTGITAIPSPIQHDRKRRRVEDSARPPPISSLEHERSERQSEKGVRRDPVVVSERYHHHPISYERDILCERETYLRPSAPPTLYESQPPQDTPHVPSYSYDGAMDMHRKGLALDHHEPSLCDHHDHYVPYVEAHAYDEPAYETGVIHAYQEPTYETSGSHAYLEPEYETGVTHAYREPAYETGVAHAYREPAYETGVSHAFREPEYETGVTHAYRKPAYETVASHCYRDPEYEAGVSHAFRDPQYEPGVTHVYREPTHETGVRHAFQDPTYEAGVTHAYREPTHEAGVSRAFREPTYEAGLSHRFQKPTYETGVSHAAYQEPRYEIMGANQEPHGYSYERQQVEYYRHGAYHDRPPLPPFRRY